MENDGRRDFDFHIRPCRVRNQRLLRRLEGCTEWQEFDATQEAQLVVGGLGNVDHLHCPDFPGGPLEGMTIRAFDPRTRLWSIYWLDNRVCELQPPVIGRFEGRRGEFHGDDTFAGRPIRVRYIWNHSGANAATWEQAFSTDGGETWETNWRMFMTYDQQADQ
ncbi:MAG TPA: hypothetical protein VNO33_22690 [Kofleriaceae bacterium]|nr:hypothetical protein [Kofleriaceae bacterium]